MWVRSEWREESNIGDFRMEYMMKKNRNLPVGLILILTNTFKRFMDTVVNFDNDRHDKK